MVRVGDRRYILPAQVSVRVGNRRSTEKSPALMMLPRPIERIVVLMPSPAHVMGRVAVGGFGIGRSVPRLALRMRSLRGTIRLFASCSRSDRGCVILSIAMMRCGRRRIVGGQRNVHVLLGGHRETTKRKQDRCHSQNR